MSSTNKVIIIVLLLLGFILAGIVATAFYLQLSESRQQFAQAQDQSSKLNEKVTQLQSQVAILQPMAEKVRQLPIKYGFRKALLGNGLVLEIRNISPNILSLNITITNTTFNQAKVFNEVLDSGRLLQLGHMQGAQIAPGDRITITSDGYDAGQINVPQ